MKTIQELNRYFRKSTRMYAGNDGEAYAKHWLETHKWKFLPLETRVDDLPEELKKRGGKRVDFIAEADSDFILLLDAKYHSTDNCKTFTITEDELRQYRRGSEYLLEYLAERDQSYAVETWFMVFPKECDGERVVWVELSEMENGTPTMLREKAARKVSLESRAEWWSSNSVADMR